MAVTERILAKSHYYEVARELGRIVGRAGQREAGCRLIVVTGGGPGLMEAANRGAYEVGAKSAGLNIALPHEQFPNPYITPELCFQFRYFGLRKMHFMMRAKAFVAFPGGYGTLDELFEALCLIQTRKIKPLPVVLVGEQYWRRAFDAEFLAAEGTIDPEDTELFCFAETADQIWKAICAWYDDLGEPLLPLSCFFPFCWLSKKSIYPPEAESFLLSHPNNPVDEMDRKRESVQWVAKLRVRITRTKRVMRENLKSFSQKKYRTERRTRA